MNGTPIIEQMPIRIPIIVTERDIDHGAGRSCMGCPIALATNRALRMITDQDIYARVVPYACFADTYFKLVHEWTRKEVELEYPSVVYDFAFAFDKWDDYRSDPEEWSEQNIRNGGRPGDIAWRPDPFSFVLTIPREEFRALEKR